MDIQMPHVSGIEGVKLIKKEFPSLQVLMQTVFEDDENVFNSIRAGAAGYILKKSSPDKIIDAVKDAYEGGSPMTHVIARKVLEFFKKQPHVQEENKFNLSEREMEILSLLVQGLSYRMIAARCSISYFTLNSHIKKIYEKLHVHSAGEAVAKAITSKIVHGAL